MDKFDYINHMLDVFYTHCKLYNNVKRRIVMNTIITGASDDLIEVRGELDDEFCCYDCEDGRIACSDGTLLRARYDGIWIFDVIFKGDLFDCKVSGDYENDIDDEINFKPGLKWIIFTNDYQFALKDKQIKI